MPSLTISPTVREDDAFQGVYAMLLDAHEYWLLADTTVPVEIATKTPSAVAFARAESAFLQFIDTLLANRMSAASRSL